jgi:hypothetical protein
MRGDPGRTPGVDAGRGLSDVRLESQPRCPMCGFRDVTLLSRTASRRRGAAVKTVPGGLVEVPNPLKSLG